MNTLIKNAKVITPDFRGFCEKDVFIVGDKIADSLPDEADKVIDAGGNFLLPGLVDMHIHGSYMGNFASTESFDRALKYTAKAGVTTVVATIGVNPIDTIISYDKNIVDKSKEYVDSISSEANRYIGKRRLVLKAYLGVTWAIQSPQKVFTHIDSMLKMVRWEASAVLYECFKQLLEI